MKQQHFANIVKCKHPSPEKALEGGEPASKATEKSNIISHVSHINIIQKAKKS